VRVHPEL